MVGSLVHGIQGLDGLLDLLHGGGCINAGFESPVEGVASRGFFHALGCGMQPCSAATQGSLVINHDDDPCRPSLHGQAHKVVGLVNGSTSNAGALHDVFHETERTPELENSRTAKG